MTINPALGEVLGYVAPLLVIGGVVLVFGVLLIWLFGPPSFWNEDEVK